MLELARGGRRLAGARLGRARGFSEECMDFQDLAMTALRATIIYFFLLVVIRLLGKRSVGPLSAFDLLVALMLGEVVDEIIYGDVTMTKGILSIVIIAVWHFVNEYASSRSDKVDRVTAGKPAVVVEHGEFKRAVLAAERLNAAEVRSQMRQNQIDDLAEIKCATLEPNGKISFILESWAEPAKKQDLNELGEQLA
jgi:uncharacterized membrane protein YcaP (DUF421 family)